MMNNAFGFCRHYVNEPSSLDMLEDEDGDDNEVLDNEANDERVEFYELLRDGN